MRSSPHPAGALLCLASAAAFGAMAVFGKHAYAAGVGVADLLLVRFALAAAVLLAAAAATGALHPFTRRPLTLRPFSRRPLTRRPLTRRPLTRRAVLSALAMGALGYAAQSALFFLALERLDASLVALILYTYPAFVLVAALVLGRERATGRRVAALVLASAGTVLVLAVATTGRVDGLGVALALGAALVYTGYILVGDRVLAGAPPLVLSALVCAGATASYALVSVLLGGPGLRFGPSGWFWAGAIALVSTVVAIVTFFAGLRRVGPSAAAILSTLEPVVTVALAAAAFGERIATQQLLGGALVLAAVVLLQTGGRPRRGQRRSAGAGTPAAVP